jgi:ABC-type antimicrobial peptide transport system permease subunit
VLADAVAGRRFNASVLGLFAQLALVLASAGVYALSRQSVVARTREIGVRMALGAHRADVVTLIARSSAGPIAAGVAVGFALAVAAGRVLAAQLFEVDPVDPPTFIAVCAIVVAAAAVATLAPALRATRIDPLVALKRD